MEFKLGATYTTYIPLVDTGCYDKIGCAVVESDTVRTISVTRRYRTVQNCDGNSCDNSVNMYKWCTLLWFYFYLFIYLFIYLFLQLHVIGYGFHGNGTTVYIMAEL